MAELSEEEKYARKSKLLQNALAEADKMDKADAAKEKSGKAKVKEQKAAAKEQQAEKDKASAAPAPLGS